MHKNYKTYHYINQPPYIISNVLPEIDFSFIKKIFKTKGEKNNADCKKSFQ